MSMDLESSVSESVEPMRPDVTFNGFEGAIRRADEVYARGQMTEARLYELVMTLYDPGNGWDGAGPDTSFGMEWLDHHFRLSGRPGEVRERELTEFIRRAIPNFHAFLVRCLASYHFTASALLRPALLRCLEPAERAAYVALAFSRHGAWNNGWVKALRAIDVPREVMAAAILNRLKRAPADADRQYQNCVTYVHDFLEYGSGVYAMDLGRTRRMDDDSEWAMLTDVEFEEALDICVLKSPKYVLKHRRHLGLRLTSEAVERRRLQAVERLTSVEHQSRAELLSLPLASRIRLCLRLIKPEHYATSMTTELVLATAIDLEVEESGLGATWFDQVPVAEHSDAVDAYRAAAVLAGERGWKTMPPWLLRRLEAFLDRDGYIVGTVRVDRFTPKGRMPTTQYVVDVGDRRYIHLEYSSSHFYPSDGQRVFVNVKRAGAVKARETGREVCINGRWLFRVSFRPMEAKDER